MCTPCCEARVVAHNNNNTGNNEAKHKRGEENKHYNGSRPPDSSVIKCMHGCRCFPLITLGNSRLTEKVCVCGLNGRTVDEADAVKGGGGIITIWRYTAALCFPVKAT